MSAWAGLRRVVTTEDARGRSRVLIDGGPAALLAADEAGLAEIWAARFGSDLLAPADSLSGAPVQLEPGPGATKIRWFTVPPEDMSKSSAEREAAAAFGFAAAGAAHARVDTARHPMMHKTETLDVIIVIDGEIDLLLDDGEATSLKAGDVVIQRATNHAWVNQGSRTALLVAVLMNGGGC